MSRGAYRRESGAVAVALLVLFAFVSALMAATLLRLRQWSARASEEVRSEELRSALDDDLREVIERIAADPTPQSDAPSDPVWEWLRAAARKDQHVALCDVSSRINPNWIRRGVFEKTALATLFTPDATVGETPVQAFLQRREERGFTVDLESSYGSFFSAETIDRYLSPWSYANLNTSDEFALRSLYEVRTGDAAGAATFHARIRKLLSDRRIVEERGLHAFLQDDDVKLFPLVNALPSWNVHYLPALILEQILAYPDYHVAEVPAKIARILARRETQEITPEELRRIVGLPPHHPLYQYLGTQTWFWRVVVTDRDERLEAVVCRLPPDPAQNGEPFAGGSPDQAPAGYDAAQFRVVNREYRK